LKLDDKIAPGKPRYPTFIEIGTNEPLYVHRRGSNVFNGEYFVDKHWENTIVHYSSFRAVNIDKLRKRYAALKATSPEVASKDSPLKGGRRDLPRYFTTRDISVSDLNVGAVKAAEDRTSDATAAQLIAALNAEGWWPTEMKAVSNPYIGDGSTTVTPGEFSQTRVGDPTDTSPYLADVPKMGISTGAYIENMAALIRYVTA
jgi:hypothetical protein